MKKTTARHFEVFQEEVLFWIEKFGLKQWEIHFVRKPLDSNRAELYWDLCGRVAVFYLSCEWESTVIHPSNAEMKDSAKHEVIELLLAECSAVARARYVTEDELKAAHHALVRRLEKLIPR